MPSDGGRDFLSTKEPERDDSKSPIDVSGELGHKADDAPFCFRDLLNQFYPGRTSK
jgi:hypothetical protein